METRIERGPQSVIFPSAGRSEVEISETVPGSELSAVATRLGESLAILVNDLEESSARYLCSQSAIQKVHLELQQQFQRVVNQVDNLPRHWFPSNIQHVLERNWRAMHASWSSARVTFSTKRNMTEALHAWDPAALFSAALARDLEGYHIPPFRSPNYTEKAAIGLAVHNLRVAAGAIATGPDENPIPPLLPPERRTELNSLLRDQRLLTWSINYDFGERTKWLLQDLRGVIHPGALVGRAALPVEEQQRFFAALAHGYNQHSPAVPLPVIVGSFQNLANLDQLADTMETTLNQLCMKVRGSTG
ncbi:MAG: hypothetical protein K1X83_05340 [Oligoflexia bacterium]|nr:hypothetical protein [Oligoflexia bacterium]